MGIRCADHVTPLYLQKLALTSPTGGGRSVGIVRVRTKATEFVLFVVENTGSFIEVRIQLDIGQCADAYDPNNKSQVFYIFSSVHRNSRLKKSKEMQQYAEIYLLQNYSTCFGHLSCPSSGVLCTPEDGRDGRPKHVE